MLDLGRGLRSTELHSSCAFVVVEAEIEAAIRDASSKQKKRKIPLR